MTEKSKARKRMIRCVEKLIQKKAEVRRFEEGVVITDIKAESRRIPLKFIPRPTLVYLKDDK